MLTYRVKEITQVLFICKPDKTAFPNVTILIENYNCTQVYTQVQKNRLHYRLFGWRIYICPRMEGNPKFYNTVSLVELKTLDTL